MKDIAFDLQQFKQVEQLGTLPRPIQAAIIACCVSALLVAGYIFDTSVLMEDLSSKIQEEEVLKQSFEDKHKKAANLAAYKEQMVVMKASFGALLSQLPEQNEVPGLVEDISHQGLASGLAFRTIRLLPERQMDFYIELPIQIVVMGTYHQLSNFVSNVAGLPRIVTLHDFSIKAVDPNRPNDLVMEILAKTYRYSENENIAPQDGKAAKNAKDPKKAPPSPAKGAHP